MFFLNLGEIVDPLVNNFSKEWIQSLSLNYHVIGMRNSIINHASETRVRFALHSNSSRRSNKKIEHTQLFDVSRIIASMFCSFPCGSKIRLESSRMYS